MYPVLLRGEINLLYTRPMVCNICEKVFYSDSFGSKPFGDILGPCLNQFDFEKWMPKHFTQLHLA